MLRIGIVAAAVWLIIDQATKWWILHHIMNPPRVIPVTGFFNIVLSRNTGVSFGFFGGTPALLLIAVTVTMIVSLFVWMLWIERRLAALALGLIAGGGAGNLIDRWRYGGVTDFLDFHAGQWHWPAFNMADVGIVCGVGFLLLDAIRPMRSQEAEQA